VGNSTRRQILAEALINRRFFGGLMPDSIFIEGGVLIPGDALEVRAVRASGPGGQNVNKVATKIEIHVDLKRVQGMGAESLQRLNRLVAKRLDSYGRLMVTSQRTRDQQRNLDDARRKIHDWIAQALVKPKKRVPTQPKPVSRERRLEDKKRHAARKADRHIPLSDIE
jgi:ribosome-associated protein